MDPQLKLIVLRTNNIDAMRTFYTTLGCNFVQEQHGNGPIHYAADMEGIVLEIYPGKEGQPLTPLQSGATMLGFTVHSLDATVSALEQQGAKIKTPPQISYGRKRAVVYDPDGRTVDLIQKSS